MIESLNLIDKNTIFKWLCLGLNHVRITRKIPKHLNLLLFYE
jgi:hypothetical protein